MLNILSVPLGIILALLVTFALKFLLDRTKLGYEIKTVGANQKAAQYAGNAGFGQSNFRNDSSQSTEKQNPDYDWQKIKADAEQKFRNTFNFDKIENFNLSEFLGQIFKRHPWSEIEEYLIVGTSIKARVRFMSNLIFFPRKIVIVTEVPTGPRKRSKTSSLDISGVGSPLIAIIKSPD